MAQVIRTYQPFDHTIELSNSLKAKWILQSEGFLQTMQKVILVAGLTLLTFLVAIFEGLIALPLLTARKFCYSQPNQVPSPQLLAVPPFRQAGRPPLVALPQRRQAVAMPEIQPQAREVE